ncbi:MAG: hypothetical protein AAB303_03035 [Chloroflexota bacterium]
MNIAIPLATSVVSFLFALSVLDQFLERRRPYQLVWTVGLFLYGAASLLQTLWAVGISGELVFRLWYLTGAMLVAAYLGMGSLYLHLSRKAANGVLIGLLVLTAASFVMSLFVSLNANVGLLEGHDLASVVPGTESQRYYPAYVGILTAILNILGSLALVGSAVYSAVVVVRRKAPSYRAVSNVLIAIGAFVSAAGGTLERFDVPQPHTVALLLGVIIIYIGFVRSREVFTVYRIPFRRSVKEARS